MMMYLWWISIDLAKYNYTVVAVLKLLDHVKKGIKNAVFESLLAIAGY